MNNIWNHSLLWLLGLTSILFSQDFWKKLPAPATKKTYSSFERLVISANDEIFIASDSGLLKSVDGGNTWVGLLNEIPKGKNPINWVHESKTGILSVGGIAIGNDRILQSTNGGLQWDTVKIPNQFLGGTGSGAKSITYAGPNNLFIGLDGADAIVRSQNNGTTFSYVFGNSTYSFSGWDFLATDKFGRIYGSQYSGAYGTKGNKPKVFRSSDNGEKWDTLSIPVLSQLQTNDMTSNFISKTGEIYFMTESSIVKTTAEGTGLAVYAKMDTSFRNQYGVFGVREDGVIFSASGNSIYMSSDLGLTWKVENRGIDTIMRQIDNINVLKIDMDSKGFTYLYGPNGLYKSLSGVEASKIQSRINQVASPVRNSKYFFYDLIGRKVRPNFHLNVHEQPLSE